VLIDIGLPGMDGYELAQELRRRVWVRRPLLIAATGFGTTEDRRRSFEAGIDLHYVKPLDPCALDSLLKNTAQITSYASTGVLMPEDTAARLVCSQQPSVQQ